MSKDDQMLEARNKAALTLKEQLIDKIGKAQATLLLQRTPAGEVRRRKLNPNNPNSPTFDYIEHAYVSETLNFATGLDWDLVVTSQERVGEEALVGGYIEVRLKEITIRKHGFGAAKRIAANQNQTWGDVFNSATSRLLKVCAARMGLGLDLYRHEERKIEEAYTPREIKEAPKLMVKETKKIEEQRVFEAGTPEQIVTINALAKAQNITDLPERFTKEEATAWIGEHIGGAK